MPQPSTNGKRGRPPGTGKNDTDRLMKIAALMAADPALKPTTAIKQIGETDPSTIRRLRDKLNEQYATITASAPVNTPAAFAAPKPPQLDVITNVAPVAAPALQPMPQVAAAQLAVSTATPASVAIPAAQTVKASEIEFEHLFKPAPVQDPFMIFGKWFGNGIETAAVLFEQQMMFAQSMLKAAPMKAVWRQQIVATEYLLMLSGPGQRISTTAPANAA
jgi:hypothetical protein